MGTSALTADGHSRARISSYDHGGETWPPDCEVIDAAPELQYGGATFESASEYVRGLQTWTEPARARVARALTDVEGSRAVAAELGGLHSVAVSLSDSPAGRLIARHLAEQRWGVDRNRMAQGILLLPPTFADYRRGRARQAMRTNNRAATEEGITCRRLEPGAVQSSFERWERQGVLPDKVAHHYRLCEPNAVRDARWYVALDRTTSPVGVAKVWVDTEWALLSGMACVSHSTRWLLHTHIVEELYRAEVGRLCIRDGLSLQMSPAHQYFQRLLGYRVAHLRVAATPRARRVAWRDRATALLSKSLTSDSIVTRAGLAAILCQW